MQKIFQHPNLDIEENLDEKLLKKYNLINRKQALQNLHLPQNKQMLDKAIQRFKYEEALIIIKKWCQIQQLPFKQPLKCNISYVKQMIQEIPFILNLNQKNSK